MTVRELIERLHEYKPTTNVYISTDDTDPIGGCETINGIGEVKDCGESVDGIYLLGF